MPSATWSKVLPCLFWPIEQQEVKPNHSIDSKDIKKHSKTPFEVLRNPFSPTVPFVRFPCDQFTGICLEGKFKLWENLERWLHEPGMRKGAASCTAFQGLSSPEKVARLSGGAKKKAKKPPPVSTARTVSLESVKHLKEMGFDEDAAKLALEATNGGLRGIS